MTAPGAENGILELALLMRAALDNDRLGDVPELLARGASVDEAGKDGMTALMLATQKGDLGMMEQVLDAGADINRENRYHQTALMLSFSGPQHEAARLLLKRGAAFDMERVRSRLMCGTNLLDLIPDFIDRGMDPNVVYSSNTPLAYATINGKTELVERLLERDADIDFKNCNGYTALMYAAVNNHADTVRVLLNHGADTEALNKWGGTVLDELDKREERNYTQVRALLREEVDRRRMEQEQKAAAEAAAEAARRAARMAALKKQAVKPAFRKPAP